MIDEELLDDTNATMAWLSSLDETPLGLAAAHARYVLVRLLGELQTDQ